jgi:hypothetical protein
LRSFCFLVVREAPGGPSRLPPTLSHKIFYLNGLVVDLVWFKSGLVWVVWTRRMPGLEKFGRLKVVKDGSEDLDPGKETGLRYGRTKTLLLSLILSCLSIGGLWERRG